MAGIDTRALLVAIDPDGNLKPARLDEFGNLRSTASIQSVTLGSVTIADPEDGTLKVQVTPAGAMVVDVVDTEFIVSNFPASYALPAAQVTDLKTVVVSNLPTEYPLPAAQVTALQPPAVQITEEIAYEERYEFDAEGNPLYVGKAPDGTATTAAAWTVYRFTFVAGLPTRKQVRENIVWDNRAAVAW